MGMRGYIRESRYSSASTQSKILEEAGVTVIYEEGRKSETFEVAVRSLRKGEAFVVSDITILAKDRDELEERLEIIHARQGYLLEASSQLSSRDPLQLAKMIFKASNILGQRRKGLDRKRASEYGARGGKPPIPWTDAQKAMIESYWYNTKMYATNADAVAAMNAQLEKDGCKHRVSAPNYVWRMMKDKYGEAKAGSGRVTGPRRKIVAKPKRR